MKIYDELDALIKKYQPDVMGVEKLFFNRNVTTAIPVGQARGIVLLTAAKNNLRLVERTPMQIKQDVTGYGKADKNQVIYMVTKILHLPAPPKPDDPSGPCPKPPPRRGFGGGSNLQTRLRRERSDGRSGASDRKSDGVRSRI